MVMFNFQFVLAHRLTLSCNRHEHLYGSIQENLIRTDELPADQTAAERVIGQSCIILSTLSTLSNPALDQNGMFRIVPVERLIVDEASQIRIFEFLVSSMTGN